MFRLNAGPRSAPRRRRESQVVPQPPHPQPLLLDRLQQGLGAGAQTGARGVVGVDGDDVTGVQAVVAAGVGEVAVVPQGRPPQDDGRDAAVGGGAQGGGVVRAVGRAEQMGPDAEAGLEFGLLAADLGALARVGQAPQRAVVERVVLDARADRAQPGEVPVGRSGDRVGEEQGGREAVFADEVGEVRVAFGAVVEGEEDDRVGGGTWSTTGGRRCPRSPPRAGSAPAWGLAGPSERAAQPVSSGTARTTKAARALPAGRSRPRLTGSPPAGPRRIPRR